jgi:ubiquinol-cytochrome c reductase cytochrome b subunit
LAAFLTGDLLSWDQNGYAATKTRTGFLVYLPWVGESLHRLAIGGPGPEMGHLALTRFFALHVGLFGGGFLALLFLRAVLSRRANVRELSHSSTSYWPSQAWRSAAACLVVLAAILLLACQHGLAPPEAGVPTLSPADPANSYVAARPEWFLVGVFEFSQWFPGGWEIVPIFIVPGALVCIVLAMPFVASCRIGHGFNIAFTLFVLAALTWLSWSSYAKDRANPAHQKAVAVERWHADRVCELIQHNGGIPPAGALSLLRKDPRTEVRRLFVQQCASCHNHVSQGNIVDVVPDISIDEPSAPNLGGYASRSWLTGLLDPKRIVGPEYFGNTKFRKMAGFVKERLSDLDEEEKQSLKKVIMAVSAEAQLPSQREMDARDAKDIEEGRKLLVEDFSCTDCHKFHDKGKLGDAPNLTGYGSRQWIAGILGNPAEKRFYGKRNLMPCYAPSASNAAENTLNPLQIEFLTDWLRGEWYEEK